MVLVVHLQGLNFLVSLLKPVAQLCMEMTSDPSWSLVEGQMYESKNWVEIKVIGAQDVLMSSSIVNIDWNNLSSHLL